MFKDFYTDPKSMADIGQAENLIEQAVMPYNRRFFHSFGFMTYDRNLGFADDARFMETVARHQHLFDISNWHWNLHVVLWAVKSCLSVPGDFIELGVYRGLTTGFIADYLQFQNIEKKWFLYDIFSGMPKDLLNKDWNPGLYANVDPQKWYNDVLERFKPYPNIQVIKGKVPDVLREKCPEKIAFIHIDLNSAPAEIAALEFLLDRVSPGGILLFDDFGWTASNQQNREENKFFNDRGYMVLEIPTGQGIVIKR